MSLTSRKLSAAFLAAMSVLISGCATFGKSVETNLSIFHEIQTPPAAGTTISVLPWRKELQSSLEYRAYAARIEEKLKQYGYTVTSPGTKTQLALFVDYGIDDGRIVTSSYIIPQFGVTGYSGSTTTGTVSTYGSTSYINANTTNTPTYGVTGYHSGVSNDTVYRRFVNVDIVDLTAAGEAGRKVYEGKLKSEGTCGNLPVIMPILIESLFTDFPGKSGTAGKRDMPWSGNC
jgi:hypothetical protein